MCALANHTLKSKDTFRLSPQRIEPRIAALLGFEGRRSWAITMSLHHSATPVALTEQTRADQTLRSDDLSCTHLPSPKGSFIKSANFTKPGRLPQGEV